MLNGTLSTESGPYASVGLKSRTGKEFGVFKKILRFCRRFQRSREMAGKHVVWKLYSIQCLTKKKVRRLSCGYKKVWRVSSRGDPGSLQVVALSIRVCERPARKTRKTLVNVQVAAKHLQRRLIKCSQITRTFRTL
jgi:hypothetical protein